MAEHESLQEEQAVWKQKVTAASNRYKIFQDEVKSVKRKHRHNVVESEIIEQFHEYCKSEIRDIVGETEEHREKMELYSEVKHIDVGQLLEESKVLVNENENDRKLLASLRKELTDLKIGLMDDENETDTIDDIHGDDDEEIQDSYDKISDINSRKLSREAEVKIEDDGGKTFGLDISKRHSPTTWRCISPETAKFLKSEEDKSTDLLVTNEEGSEAWEIMKNVNSEDRANHGFKYDTNKWISERAIVSRKVPVLQFGTRGRSKTKIPKPTLENSNSAIRCENKVKRKLLPRRDRSIEYVKLPIKVRSDIDANVKTQAFQKKEYKKDIKYAECDQPEQREIKSNFDDEETSGPMEENARTAECDPCSVSTGQTFTEHRSPRKLSPIGSQSKTEKATLAMTKLPPIKSKRGNNKSALPMETPSSNGSFQKLSKCSHTEEINRPTIKTRMSNKKKPTKSNVIEENDMKPVDCKKGSTKHRQEKSDIQSQSRKSTIERNHAKNTSAVSEQKLIPNIQESKKSNGKLAESKKNDMRSITRDMELPPLSNKDKKRAEIFFKSTKLPPVKPNAVNNRKCVPLKTVNISAPLPPIQIPYSSKESKIQNENEHNTKSKPLKEKNDRHAPQSKNTVTEKSYRNSGYGNDTHMVEEGVNVVGKANYLYKRKR